MTMSVGYDAEVFLRKYFESNNVIYRLFVNKATADRDKLLQPDIIMGWVDLWVGLVCLLNRRTAWLPLIHSVEWLWRLIEFYYLHTYLLSSPH